MNVAPFDNSLAPASLPSLSGNLEGGNTTFSGPAPSGDDNISRFMPPWLNSDAAAAPYAAGFNENPGSLQGLFGPLMGVLTQLMQMLQSFIGCGGYGSPCGPGTGNGCGPYNNQRYFQNAVGSSDGDPHLSFNGEKWNSMASHPDLLNSRSFAGGFRISTQATPPNARGVTWNRSATVTLNNGATTVGLNNDGVPSIESYGQQLAISPGQTLQLGDGESVTCTAAGALRLNAQNGAGGSIETALTARGNGVDVDVTAHDIDLGGALVNGYDREPGYWPAPGQAYPDQ